MMQKAEQTVRTAQSLVQQVGSHMGTTPVCLWAKLCFKVEICCITKFYNRPGLAYSPAYKKKKHKMPGGGTQDADKMLTVLVKARLCFFLR